MLSAACPTLAAVPGWISMSGDSFSVLGAAVPHCEDSLSEIPSWYRKEQEAWVRQGEGHGRAWD